MKVFKDIFLIFCLLIVTCAEAATPQQKLQTCISKLKGAASAKADFSLTAQGHTVTGILLSKGNKFSITTGADGTWYDGRDLWVYSRESGEVSVWKPTSGELAEANPLLYLSTSGDYTVSSGTGSSKGETLLTLTPKKRKAGIKNIKVLLNNSTMLPKSMEISTGSGLIRLQIKNLQLGVSVSDGSFIFPKKKYPKVRVNDLR